MDDVSPANYEVKRKLAFAKVRCNEVGVSPPKRMDGVENLADQLGLSMGVGF